jgi:hypothetical protein
MNSSAARESLASANKCRSAVWVSAIRPVRSTETPEAPRRVSLGEVLQSGLPMSVVNVLARGEGIVKDCNAGRCDCVGDKCQNFDMHRRSVISVLIIRVKRWISIENVLNRLMNQRGCRQRNHESASANPRKTGVFAAVLSMTHSVTYLELGEEPDGYVGIQVNQGNQPLTLLRADPVRGGGVDAHENTADCENNQKCRESGSSCNRPRRNHEA